MEVGFRAIADQLPCLAEFCLVKLILVLATPNVIVTDDDVDRVQV